MKTKVEFREVLMRPKRGQFIATWIYDGKPWSESYRWRRGILQVYCSGGDDWVRFISIHNELNKKYFVTRKVKGK